MFSIYRDIDTAVMGIIEGAGADGVVFRERLGGNYC